MSNAPAAFTLPVAALLVLLAGLAGVTAARGWAGTLRRTGRLGLHSPGASASDESFAMANKVAAPVVGGSAVLALVLAVLVTTLPLPATATIVLGVLAVAAVLVLLIAGGVQGEKAARTLPVPARRPAANPACSGCDCGGCGGSTGSAVALDGAAAARSGHRTDG